MTTSVLVMLGAGIILTGLAFVGLLRLRGAVQMMFCVGMLFLAATWFLPVLLSLLLQSGMNALPWPSNAILNVILYSAGAGLLLFAAVERGQAPVRREQGQHLKARQSEDDRPGPRSEAGRPSPPDSEPE